MGTVLDSHFLALTAIVTVSSLPNFESSSLFFWVSFFVWLCNSFLGNYELGLPDMVFFTDGFLSVIAIVLQVVYQFIFFVITALFKFDQVTDFAGNDGFSVSVSV